ncbi:MAG: hypothetical protein EP318_19160 [Rhodobacteraceae bacterium]|nr:MAG: hypothetical protein EP318_19160 [Paracoccaceae bacterium]
MQRADFKRPDGILLAGMGVLILAAAVVGLGMAVFMIRDADLKTNLLILLGFCGACALGYGFLNAWRVPMLSVRPDALVIPTFFGTRRIDLGPGHPLGEFLAVSQRSNRTAGTIEGNKFVHFQTLDGQGALTELVALHRDAPQIPEIRRALQQVTGLTIETLRQDPASRKVRPDIAHWRVR